MKYQNYYIGISFLVLLHWSCVTSDKASEYEHHHEIEIKGLSFVAPPKPFSTNPMIPIQAVNANWISVIPYGYTSQKNPAVRYNLKRQWWGEKAEGIIGTIQRAQAHDLKVLLKPQIYVHRSWTGFLDFSHEGGWSDWEEDYREFILFYAHLADSLDVELFCIGTELRNSVKQRPEFWDQLIEEVRSIYSGPLTYAANWDDYAEVGFWSKMDYAGINAYFPLVDQTQPSKGALLEAWEPHLNSIQHFYNQINKPILFTEFGYLSVDRCAYNTWELEANIYQCEINEMAQANALDALFTACSTLSYWKGGFLWKWFPNGEGHEGYKERDYTPQGKIGEQVIISWYGK